MARNVEQHEAFQPALETFGKYAQDCLDKVQTFDSKHFVALIDGFGSILNTHLKEEVDSLLELGKYNVPELKKAYLALVGDAKNQSKVRYPLRT